MNTTRKLLPTDPRPASPFEGEPAHEPHDTHPGMAPVNHIPPPPPHNTGT